MITYLNIEKLIPHPNNPRKDLGDLTELVDSIRTNGVLQNLTVNDNGDDTFTVIIGHRRLAALQKMGVTTAPCTVTKMDDAKQISTMLLENMQRTDLTPYEQAQGFQMCLDFGMNEELLKKQTGFSKTTIKHRLNLLKLNQDKFKKGVEKGATLQDYIDLEKIEDDKVKDKLLDDIGTNDFRYKLNNELRMQLNMKQTNEFINMLKEHMDEVEHAPEGYKYCSYLYGTSNFKNFKIPEDIDMRKYVFIKYGGGSIQIYKEILESEKEKAISKNEPSQPTQTDLNVEEIKKKVEVAYQTRLEFARSIYRSLKVDTTDSFLIKYAFDILSNSISGTWEDDEIFEQVTSKALEDIKNLRKCTDSIIKSVVCIRYLFALIYSNLENKSSSCTLFAHNYHSEYGCYDDNNADEIKELYGFLQHYGYQASEEEIAIMFGTHELYLKKGE